MDAAALLEASRRELALYRTLAEAYGALAAVLASDGPLEPERLAAEGARVAQAGDALRAVAAAIAPHRLGSERVAPEVEALWRQSAALAAEAAAANTALQRDARLREHTIRERLAVLAAGSRALVAYRPAAPHATTLAPRA